MKQLKINQKNLKQIMKEYKKWLPNLLTGMRIILTPIIIVLGIMKQIKLVIVFASIAALTDCLDGMLARKWNATSEIGAKLDAVADKCFAIGLCICLTSIFPILWACVVLEFILAMCNLYFHYKSHKTESLWIGKIKTNILFITILLVICHHFLPNFTTVTQGFIYACMNLQLLCIIEYSFNFYDNMHPITVEDNKVHQEIMQKAMEDKTIEIEDLDELIMQYEIQEEDSQ